jgi:hypothetical protein
MASSEAPPLLSDAATRKEHFRLVKALRLILSVVALWFIVVAFWFIFSGILSLQIAWVYVLFHLTEPFASDFAPISFKSFFDVLSKSFCIFFSMGLSAEMFFTTRWLLLRALESRPSDSQIYEPLVIRLAEAYLRLFFWAVMNWMRLYRSKLAEELRAEILREENNQREMHTEFDDTKEAQDTRLYHASHQV